MHRKILAALFILLLAWYQYGKLLNYIGCRINNMHSATTCDCEKQLKDLPNADNNSQPATGQSSLKERQDDLFVNNPPLFSHHVIEPDIKSFFLHAVLAAGFGISIFQPPRV